MTVVPAIPHQTPEPLLAPLADFLTRHRINEVSDFIGLIITILAFGWTICAVYRSRTAAEQARQAAQETRRTISAHSVMIDLASAIATMEEIKRLHRGRQWSILPERYGALRHALRSIHGSNTRLTNEHSTTIQASITHIAAVERRVEEALAAATDPRDAVQMIRIVDREIEKLHRVLNMIRV